MLSLALLLLAPAGSAEFFEAKVRPVFATRCYACHSGKTKMGGLDLKSAASFKNVVTDPARLIEILSYRDRVKMPPTGQIPAEELSAIREWVDAGAKWPDSPASESVAAKPKQRDLWSFHPIRNPALPEVQDRGWVKKPLDYFILAGLEKASLRPAAPADKLSFLRRLTYDLTGLPPTLAEMDAFAQGRETVEQAVDRLLASPKYGEQWGRHWLDVARYADSTGMDEDHLYPHAWRYRDYVVSAFNNDKPYDRFVKEQIAGDLLPGANNDTVVATGFLAIGPKPLAQQDRQKMVYDVVDEQIDTTSKALLGLSVACARCHDHKFDPILTRDYYSLASIFASTKAFRNLGRPGSVSYMYYAPLDREAAQRYDVHRHKVDLAFLDAEEALATENCKRNEKARERIADYLVAAYQVKKHGATHKQVDWSILDKYLCLKDLKIWKEATDANIETLAAQYADQYQRQARKWDDRLTGWLNRYKEEVIQDRDRPGKPVFDPVDDPFFDALTFHGGPLDLPDPPRVLELRAKYEALKKSMPPEPPLASAVCDGPVIEQHIHVRGDHHSLGAVAPKAFPVALAGEKAPEVTGSGRLELAEWIASKANPLTARVIVNRVWQWHFGEALVRTPNNWGATGEKPTNPELLDWLAWQFMEHGWSFKWLHREILLSASYGMSTKASEEARAKDPGNRLFSRFPRRRMSVEELRDSLLALDGSLDDALGGSLLNPDRRKRRQNFDEITRRTMYLPVRRGSIPTLLSIFDYSDATTVSDGRSRTNVAPQALFLLNSPFVRTRAETIAKRAAKEGGVSGAAQIQWLYRLILNREPDAAEVDDALTFLAGAPKQRQSADDAMASYCRVLLESNEFIYLN